MEELYFKKFKNGVGFNKIVAVECFGIDDYFLVVQSKGRANGTAKKGEKLPPVAYQIDRKVIPMLIGVIEERGSVVLEHSTEGDFPTPVILQRSGRRLPLYSVLYCLYHGLDLEKDLERVRGLHTDLSLHKRMGWYNDNAGSEEATKFFHDNVVYEATKDKLPSDEYGSYAFNNGSVCLGCNNGNPDVPLIQIACDYKFFYTDYDKDLYSLLQRVRSWFLKGRKGKKLPHVKFGREVQMSLSAIIGAYYSGFIPVDETVNVRDQLVAAQEKIGALKIEFDHLFENKASNFSFAIAPMTKSSNSSLSADRTRIKRPYFFLPVYDHRNKMIFVHCGIENHQWQRKYCFGMADGGTRFAECFREFFRVVEKSQRILNTPGDECLLYYWGKPEHAYAADSPITALLEEVQASSQSDFTKYEPGCFDTMPILAPEARRE